MACHNGAPLPAIYRFAMSDDDDKQPLLEPIAGEVTSLFENPVIRGPAHYVQSITVIAASLKMSLWVNFLSAAVKEKEPFARQIKFVSPR